MNEGWKAARLGEVCQIKPPKKEAKQQLSDSDPVSFVPMSNLGQLQKDLMLQEERTLNNVYGGYTYFADNDVLLAKITPCFENGKLGIARNLINGVGFGSSEYIVFRSKGDIDPEYLFYFLSQSRFRIEGARSMTGAVGHKRVPNEFVENYPISLPPLPEQKRIVAILDEAFAAIATATANAEKNLANARELFETCRNQSTNHRNDSWALVTLGDVCQRFEYGTSTKSQATGKVPVLRMGNIQDGEIDWSDLARKIHKKGRTSFNPLIQWELRK